jgi:aminopeptidase N
MPFSSIVRSTQHALLAAWTAMAVAHSASAGGVDPLVGANTLGDTIFPLEGNGGIDVQHYDLTLGWDDATGRIDAQATLRIAATQALSRFNLDFHGLTIDRILIDGTQALYTREKDELSITLPHVVKHQEVFDVSITYHGIPDPVRDTPAFGWAKHAEGIAALSEPISAKNWYPSNNHPQDKASYTFHITVPEAYNVVANGIPGKTETTEKKSTYTFTAKMPMATYLSMIHIGHFDLEKSQTKNGTPIYDYFYRGITPAFKASFAPEQKILEFFSEKFGAYPFESAGVVVMSGKSPLAYETQTRSTFGVPISETKLAHELAHQWFGDYVSLSDWKETWLKEGFATYAAALWLEHKDKTYMDKWVKGSYESMMGITHYPKIALRDILEFFQTKERTLNTRELTALIDLGTHNHTNPQELAKALALVPPDGISSYHLEKVLSEVSFAEFVLTVKENGRFLSIMEGNVMKKDALTFEAFVKMLAKAPRKVSSLSDIYGGGTYTRGALALHALRMEVGDAPFFKILRTYLARYGNSHANSDDFIAIAQKVSGKNLDPLFKAWLEQDMIPDMPRYGLYVKDYAE